MDRTSWCNKVDAVRLNASFRLNLLLLKGQRCVLCFIKVEFTFTKGAEVREVFSGLGPLQNVILMTHKLFVKW